MLFGKPLYKLREVLLIVFLLMLAFLLLSGNVPFHPRQTLIWKLNDTTMIGGLKPTVLGSPRIVHDKSGTALFFDGVDDGLILPINPIKGWKNFTVELLFQPAADGPAEPRLVHSEDTEGNRFTMEIRVTSKGQWYLDTFLKNNKTGQRLTLIDSTSLYACGKWYWAALVYNGKSMSQYVNAKKVLDGPIAFGTTGTGQIALAVRLNQVNWYRGMIREIRFHPLALKSADLQRE